MVSVESVKIQLPQATFESGSCFRHASRIESLTTSHILSGCPSVTLSELNKNVSDMFFVRVLKSWLDENFLANQFVLNKNVPNHCMPNVTNCSTIKMEIKLKLVSVSEF